MNPAEMAVRLYDHYESIEEVKHYFGLLAIYGLAQAAEVLDDAALWERCISDDFSTELSCPGCLCPGEGPEKGTPAAYIRLRQPAHDEHHSFGPFMLALVEAQRARTG